MPFVARFIEVACKSNTFFALITIDIGLVRRAIYFYELAVLGKQRIDAVGGIHRPVESVQNVLLVIRVVGYVFFAVVRYRGVYRRNVGRRKALTLYFTVCFFFDVVESGV